MIPLQPERDFFPRFAQTVPVSRSEANLFASLLFDSEAVLSDIS